jgi:transposase InsO family protein
VLAHRLSNTLDASFCVEAIEKAIARYGAPDVFNTDQGAQFTSEAFTSALEAHGVRISMDDKGCFMSKIAIVYTPPQKNTKNGRLYTKPTNIYVHWYSYPRPASRDSGASPKQYSENGIREA